MKQFKVNCCKDNCAQDTANRNENSTLEQPGVKAPGTAKRTPFFPLKSWSIATLFPGSPSWTSTAGRCSPTCWGLRGQCRLQEKNPLSQITIQSVDLICQSSVSKLTQHTLYPCTLCILLFIVKFILWKHIKDMHKTKRHFFISHLFKSIAARIIKINQSPIGPLSKA